MGTRTGLANWGRAIFLPLPIIETRFSFVQSLVCTVSNVTGLANNFVERRMFVSLSDSALFPTVFVKLADKVLNVWPSVVKNILCEITAHKVTWNVRHS